jgi:hypothetical protein
LHLCFVFGKSIMFTTQNTIHPISLVQEKAWTQTTLVAKKQKLAQNSCVIRLSAHITLLNT